MDKWVIKRRMAKNKKSRLRREKKECQTGDQKECAVKSSAENRKISGWLAVELADVGFLIQKRWIG